MARTRRVLASIATPDGSLMTIPRSRTRTSLFALPAIRQPTLIVAGTDDPIIPVANARIMSRLLPHAEVHLHAGGHIDLITNAGELAPVIHTFLKRQA